MATADFTTKLTDLVNYLDARAEEIHGYVINIYGYAEHDLSVQPFPKTAEDGQAVADALGLTFTQHDRWPYSYEATRDGVRYGFHLDKQDTYPAAFRPAEVTV